MNVDDDERQTRIPFPRRSWIDDAPWMTTALRELGEQEIAGPANSLRVIEYHKATTLGAKRDSVPWCSSFVCWVLEQQHLPHTSSAAAVSYLKYGLGGDFRMGSIVVLRRGAQLWKGHVGFAVSRDKGGVYILGGNQGDQVSVKRYAAWRVRGYRWPDVAT